MAESLIRVEVVYAMPERQTLMAVDVPAGTTLFAAVELSGIARCVTGVDLAQCSLGIFGKVVANPHERILIEGERVEIYRPLLADPKEVRRLRAEKAALEKKRQKSI